MKNKPKKPANPDLRTVRPVRRQWPLIRLAGFALGLSLLLGLFTLMVIGLPSNLTHRITALVQQAGIPLQIDSIRLSPHRGWVLKNARLYSTSPDDLQPLLQAKKLYVMPWPVSWKNPTGSWRIHLFVRDLGVSLGRPWESVLPEKHPFRTVSKLTASLIASPGQVTVEQADLRWGGITIQANGSTQFSDGEAEPRQSTIDFRRRAAKAADLLSRLKCKKAPQINLSFNYNESCPDETFLDVSLTAKGITVRDREYEQLSGTFGYRNSIWTLSAARLIRSAGEQLALHGSFNLVNSNLQASATNSLSASDLFSLLPEDAQSAVAQTGIKPYGRLDFSASVGPAPFDRLAETAKVQVQKAQVTRNDLTMDPLAFNLTRTGSRIEMTDIKALANGGPLSGRFEYDLTSGAWKAQAQAQCDPTPVGTLAGEGLPEFINRFRFPAEQPKADLTVSQPGPGGLIFVSGTLSANHFTCAGIPFTRLETFMVYSNQALTLTGLHATGEQAQFGGNIQVDFFRQLSVFDVTNSFQPAAIARVLAPNEHTVIERFVFTGPIYASGSGQIDYGQWTNHNVRGTFRADRAGLEQLQISDLQTDINLLGTQLLFTNSTFRMYGGQAEGTAGFDILLADGTAPYYMNTRITGIDLAEILEQLSPNKTDRSRTRGQLSGTLNFSADAKAGFWPSVRGKGRMEIRNGRLAELPLFGGFSRLTQSAFPGFSLFSLTDFTADYALHSSSIWSENAQLGGTLFSARGRGRYSPETGLDFSVVAEPMRQTGDKEWYQLHRLAATALRGGTAPFFRLLEFKLEGPLTNPQWRFANLSKPGLEIPPLLPELQESGK